ncbi:cell wall hydrolase [Thermovenabulum gondwanense]|uniref:Spore cortex-lytic enzyme n=1 Tax=Thermovenabulum gondwanense TaxID=520767 RepID=A0A161PV13_9FIRM|nr:cell wall hydrolase [Thermovenabulum gondwanense]KYO63986.1 Spore cortex-lytic enzyme [Thermovenabulum gondwanense]
MRKKMLIFFIILLMGILITSHVFASTSGIVLKEGMRGREVALLQQKLKELGYYYGSVDGVFGWRTKLAVMNFQRSRGLKVDGIAGYWTLRALNLSFDNTYRGYEGRFSARDIELLARLVYAEARGEPYIGQVAVAASVLNRIKSPLYPNSIPEVIFQIEGGRYQYSCVPDGQINLVPDETARKAVYDALSGFDPSKGAIGYYNPKKTNDLWVRQRPVTVIIGDHVFFK